ncbi:uncharacterized protein LOC135298272 [Passer domesticus]|uniref:uncharacterized protein LOC135298272 n=1 Tax=Passer domesticus TaxID=48849 RepID=UPI0030FEAB9D
MERERKEPLPPQRHRHEFPQLRGPGSKPTPPSKKAAAALTWRRGRGAPRCPRAVPARSPRPQPGVRSPALSPRCPRGRSPACGAPRCPRAVPALSPRGPRAVPAAAARRAEPRAVPALSPRCPRAVPARSPRCPRGRSPACGAPEPPAPLAAFWEAAPKNGAAVPSGGTSRALGGEGDPTRRVIWGSNRINGYRCVDRQNPKHLWKRNGKHWFGEEGERLGHISSWGETRGWRHLLSSVPRLLGKVINASQFASGSTHVIPEIISGRRSNCRSRTRPGKDSPVTGGELLRDSEDSQRHSNQLQVAARAQTIQWSTGMEFVEITEAGNISVEHPGLVHGHIFKLEKKPQQGQELAELRQSWPQNCNGVLKCVRNVIVTETPPPLIPARGSELASAPRADGAEQQLLKFHP